MPRVYNSIFAGFLAFAATLSCRTGLAQTTPTVTDDVRQAIANEVSLQPGEVLLLDMLTQSLGRPETAASTAAMVANTVQSNARTYEPGNRFVSAEYLQLLGGVKKRDADVELPASVRSVLYRRAPLGAVLRGRGPSSEPSPQVLEYLRRLERLTQLTIEGDRVVTPQVVLDAILAHGDEGKVVGALALSSELTARRFFWNDVSLASTGVLAGNLVPSTLFEPDSATWSSAGATSMISFSLGSDAERVDVQLKVVVVRVIRPWMRPALFERSDWFYSAHSSPVVAPSLATTKPVAQELLQFVPTRLVLLRSVTLSNDKTSLHILQKWKSASNDPTSSSVRDLVVIGVICMQPKIPLE